MMKIGKFRRVLGNTLKAISLLALMALGAIFGSEALDEGMLPLGAILAFVFIAALFCVG